MERVQAVSRGRFDTSRFADPDSPCLRLKTRPRATDLGGDWRALVRGGRQCIGDALQATGMVGGHHATSIHQRSLLRDRPLVARALLHLNQAIAEHMRAVGLVLRVLLVPCITAL